MPLLALIAIFIVVPLAELYVILRVGDAIGLLPTLAILVADSLLGSWLLKTQGRAVWNRFNAAVGAGRVPHREVIDGVLIIFGGAFLITPGFITDIVGVFLLLPPTRAVVRRIARRSIERRAVVRVASRAGRSRRRSGGQDYDVEGTASEVDWDTRRLPR
ncbi:MAG: FxsA family protein [Thermoleophilaceae bacterium]